MENGYEKIGNRSHLRHNVLKYTQMDETKVKFGLTEDDEENKSNTHEKVETGKEEGCKVRRRGRTKKEDKDSETVTSEETLQGISARTLSKDRPACSDSAPPPVRSCLKKKRDTST